jgi:hypothetical protein
MLSLFIDDRESAVLKSIDVPADSVVEFDRIRVFIKKQRLDIGDFQIFLGDQIRIVIERKTWADLASSVCDGRIDNVNKLLALREKHPACSILYLIEGSPRTKKERIGRMPFKALQAHLDHLILRDRISMIYSTNAQDSGVRIFELIRNLSTLKMPEVPAEIKELTVTEESGGAVTDAVIDADAPVEPTKLTQAAGPIKLDSVSFKKSEDWDIKSIYTAIPGVSGNLAALLYEARITLQDLIFGEVSLETLEKLRYSMSGRHVGKKQAAKVLASAAIIPLSNILVKMEGVSDKIADAVVKSLTPDEVKSLLLGELPAERLRDIKNGNRRIGVVGTRIVHTLTKCLQLSNRTEGVVELAGVECAEV